MRSKWRTHLWTRISRKRSAKRKRRETAWRQCGASGSLHLRSSHLAQRTEALDEAQRRMARLFIMAK